MTEADPNLAAKLIANKRLELSAGYLNTAATAFLTVGVVGPVVAVFYGITSAPVPVPTLALGVACWLGASITLHFAARTILKGVKP